MDLISTSKYFIFIGAIFILVGTAIYFVSKLGVNLGKLSGDILIHKGNMTFHFPLITSLLISIILTVILNLVSKK